MLLDLSTQPSWHRYDERSVPKKRGLGWDIGSPPPPLLKRLLALQLPRFTHFTPQVYNRVVALAWIHLLGPIALITMAGVGALGFGWAPQFASSQGAGVPLVAICFLKVSEGVP